MRILARICFDFIGKVGKKAFGLESTHNHKANNNNNNKQIRNTYENNLIMTSGGKTILGMGNPLLDISAVVPESLLSKYGISLNNAILAEEKHLPLYDEMVAEHDVEYIAGGATQNSMRVAQWMLQREGATAFSGSVSNDKYGDKLYAVASAAGVNVQYYRTDEAATGTCAVCINGGERSLVANLAAANCYKHSHTESDTMTSLIHSSDIFYISGFFLSVPEGPKSMVHIGEHASTSNKIFCMNLSAPFLIQFFSEQMNSVLPYTDFIFANETEAETWGKANGMEGAKLEDVALKLSSLPKKSGSRCRTVVFTQGADPTIVAQNGKVSTYAVPKLNKELLIDTNGAGDAFVGGFLARLADGKCFRFFFNDILKPCTLTFFFCRR